jgi:hypothetical protein
VGRRRKKSRNLGECAYCPAQATTEDHVPPKGMFAKATQHKPWVPACETCNGGASMDDEYMQRLSMLWGADKSRDAIEVGDKFMRSLDKPEAGGLQAQVRRSLSTVEDELLYPGGIGMALEGDRLGRVMEKIVRGWFFKLRGQRLPDGYEVMTYNKGKKPGNPLYVANEEAITRIAGYYVGDMAFAYQAAFSPSDPNLSCWRLVFYKVFEVMAYTCKMGERDFQLVDLRNPYAVISFEPPVDGE